MKNDGVRVVMEMVRAVELSDPQGEKYRRSSISDDATALFVNCNQ